MNKVAVVIVNYNMPERADALAEHIKANLHNKKESPIIEIVSAS